MKLCRRSEKERKREREEWEKEKEKRKERCEKNYLVGVYNCMYFLCTHALLVYMYID